ncbi:hypothetical protein FKO01_12275 [Mesorhizobium sp. B2-3-3]|nr:hypothetical protein FKO01_12275 [Mesorhizobium sp. B2-3-3]
MLPESAVPTDWRRLGSDEGMPDLPSLQLTMVLPQQLRLQSASSQVIVDSYVLSASKPLVLAAMRLVVATEDQYAPTDLGILSDADGALNLRN